MVRESATPVYEICRLPESTDMTCRADAHRDVAQNDDGPAGAGAIQSVDQRTAWVGMGHGLAAVATLGVTLAGVWSTIAVVLSLWGWAGAATKENLGFWTQAGRWGGVVLATAGVIGGIVVTLMWIVPRVQVAIDSYERRKAKVVASSWWRRLRKG